MNVSVKQWWRDFAKEKLPLAIVNALILGLLATAITDRWQNNRKHAELQLALLKEFEDRSNDLVGCMMAPRAMFQDRECLVVELDLLGMESTFSVVYESSFTDDFSDIARIIADAHTRTTEAGKWLLSDQAFEQFRVAYTERVQRIRQKMLKELGAF